MLCAGPRVAVRPGRAVTAAREGSRPGGTRRCGAPRADRAPSRPIARGRRRGAKTHRVSVRRQKLPWAAPQLRAIPADDSTRRSGSPRPQLDSRAPPGVRAAPPGCAHRSAAPRLHNALLPAVTRSPPARRAAEEHWDSALPAAAFGLPARVCALSLGPASPSPHLSPLTDVHQTGRLQEVALSSLLSSVSRQPTFPTACAFLLTGQQPAWHSRCCRLRPGDSAGICTVCSRLSQKHPSVCFPNGPLKRPWPSAATHRPYSELQREVEAQEEPQGGIFGVGLAGTHLVHSAALGAALSLRASAERRAVPSRAET